MRRILVLLLLLTSTTVKAESASLLLHYPAIGEHTAFAYGIEKGFYKEEGIDLKLIEGKGSADTCKTMIREQSEPRFGWTDAGAMVKVNGAENGDLMMIANFVQGGVAGLATFKEHNIKSLKDLKGKSVAFAANDGSRLMYKALLRMNNLEPKDYPELLLSPEVKLNALITGTAYAMGGLVTAQGGLIEREAKGKQVEWISMADLGMSAMGGGLIIRGNHKSERDLNCRMVKATVKSWTEAIKDPSGATAALLKMFPKASRGSQEALLVQWKGAADKLYSKASAAAAKPGRMVASDWDNLVKFQHDYGDVKTRPPTEYYTNEFFDCKK